MKTLKRILGFILIGFGLAFVFRIPGNWQSTDPKAHNKVGADVFLIVAFCGSGAALLSSSWKKEI